MIGGVGLNRERQHPYEIHVGDSIDVWRVILADKDTSHLIIYAGTKVPNEAWLQFKIEQKNHESFKGLLGLLYWYALDPFHFFIRL